MNNLISNVLEPLSQFRLRSWFMKAVLSGLHLTSFGGIGIKTIADFNASCSSIVAQLEIVIPNSTLYFSDLVSARTTMQLSDNHLSCGRTSQLVYEDICRISLYVSTSNRSGINMEVWLPRKWTGRFLSTGNGGLSGCIQYEDMAYGSALGIATVGANNGHNGTSGGAFLGNSDIVEDYAYRSIHTGVVVGKAISKRFYGAAHTKSYYIGCSTGGRQGLKSVQDFPQDFDGVVAGAPANAFSGLLSWSGRHYGITGTPGFSSFITEEQWTNLIHPDIMEQCDTIDGVADGVIEDPNLCDYKSERLVCLSNAKDRSKCLSGEQAKTIRKIFSPLYSPEGKLWYPRQQPGSEDIIAKNMMYSGKPFPYTALRLAQDWFRYALYNNPELDVTKLNMTDWAYSQAVNPFNIDTWEGDLSRFRSRNGKLITWHGQADGLISPANSERYYNHVSHTMNMPPSELDHFYRFFRVSGSGHCRGGDGPWAIGQSLKALGKAGKLDEEFLNPDKNLLTAMIRWVEEGKAPETILGRKYANDSLATDIQSSRRHCRYPLRNRYDGIGDNSQPDSWSCK
ncbi:Tannase/feruloyl esterase [Lentinula aciculospora]|uniref:Carboxylic ester hydrolase n=1 Tax=Lentinula aciculospora TaxID=153920 RepID=A0A9W9AWM6_9AGAR|nr:Tannase/feruloyl esterase [Lentinula aciculospora]